MIYIAITLFALSSVLGLIILIKWLTQKDASKTVIYSHGLVAAVALVVLLVYAYQNPLHFPRLSIFLFAIAALGGVYMFINDLRKKPSPLTFAFIHALLAVGAFVTLLAFVFL